jgi:hypothetical protein
LKKNKQIWVARLGLLVAALWLAGPAARAQDAPAPVERRTFSERDWQRLHEELDYSETPRTPEQPRQREDNARKKQAPATSSSLWQIILLGLVVAALGWFLWQTYGKPGRQVRATTGDDDDDDAMEAIAHNLLETELDPLLAQAEARGAWHLATRLRFLALLQAMHAGGRIRWLKNKTNRDYVLEAAAWAGASEFGRLTLAYERIWYGLYYPDEATYRVLAADFSTLAAAARAAHAPV